jgi:iron-regulated transporter 1
MMRSAKISDEELNQGPYQNSYILYIMHFCFAFTARMWDMGITFLLADLSDNNLSLVAFSGFLSSLFVVLFMPYIGHYLDETNRLSAAQLALGVKLSAIVTAYVLCGYLSLVKGTADFSKILLWFVPFITASANISFSTVSQSVEKDWLVVLANTDSRWLSRTNSRMTQIDSICNAFGPVLTGFLFVTVDISSAAGILLLTNAFSTLLLYIFMHSLYKSWSSLSTRNTSRVLPPSVKLVVQETTPLLGSTRAEPPIESGKPYFDDFLRSGCAGTMISFAFLYLTVLNFGSLMTVYLRWCNVSDGWIGTARGAGEHPFICYYCFLLSMLLLNFPGAFTALLGIQLENKQIKQYCHQ